MCMPLKDEAHVREPTISGVAREGAMGADHPGRHFKGGRQNRAFDVDEMVRKKVFKGTENFWERRKIFRVVGGKLLG